MIAFNRSTVVAVLAAGALVNAAAGAPSFTKDQANEGRKVYRQSCALCHGLKLEGLHVSPALSGARFDQSWRGKSADILSFHLHRMPPEAANVPKDLSDADYANLLAYILMSNDFPEGDSELPSDMAALSKVKIPRLKGVDYDPDAPVDATEEQKTLLASLTEITSETLKNPSPNDWLQWGRASDGQSFSPLTQISNENVGDLRPAWRASLRSGSSMAAPLVHDGVMFLHTYPDTVLAMDATNGDVLWRYQYKSSKGSSSKMGLGLHGDKVLVPTSDLHVQALNAKTGALIWDHEITTESDGKGMGGYQLRTSPFVVGDKVLQGITGSFQAKGGFMLALDLESGEECWRFNSIARPGEMGGDTWNDLPLDKRSGGSVWHQATYDPELNLIYYGIAPTYDTGPMLHSVNKEGVSNDALFTNCTVAIDADTGDLVWHYQHMANDQWDLDWAFERQIATFEVDGKPRKVVMNVGKMAVLEALDAETGEYLFSVDTGVQNVITAIDPETGAKTIDPGTLPDPDRECLVCPSAGGARSWPLTSYSPQTNLVYVPLTEWCMVLGKKGMRLLTSGVGISEAPHPDSSDGTIGRLQAIDVTTQQLAWKSDHVAPISTGVLATAGGLVFAGDMDPALKAFDAATGELLWQTGLDDNPSTNLITYAVNDIQYVAVIVGINNLHVDMLAGTYAEFAANLDEPRGKSPKGGAAVWVFTL
jgi:alcohol dehydrogenase (cytochrome c)